MVTITDEHRYRSIVTDKGKEKIAAAALNGQKVNIVYAAVGDGGGSYCIPTANMTALINEVWRGEIANKQINPDSANMIDVKVVLPADVGGFTAREAGFFDTEGDLIAVCNMPPTEKAIIATGAAGTLTLLIHIVFTDVDTVEFKINPTLDPVSVADVERMIREHDNDPNAHPKRKGNVKIGPVDTELEANDTLFIVDDWQTVEIFSAAAYSNMVFGAESPESAQYWAETSASGSTGSSENDIEDVSVTSGKLAVSQEEPEDAAFFAKIN